MARFDLSDFEWSVSLAVVAEANDMPDGLGDGDVLFTDRAYGSNARVLGQTRRLDLRQTQAEPQKKHSAVQPLPLSLQQARRALFSKLTHLRAVTHSLR